MSILFGLLLFSGCSKEYEGDEPGECEDGADNNQDGLVDCDDKGCEGAPVCKPPTIDELVNIDGIWCDRELNVPYTGKSVSYYPKGQKELEAFYKNGEPHGLHTSWYENGQKKSEENWKDGKKHGLETEWYENGQKSSEYNYKDGVPHGFWTSWYENGQKRY